MNKIKQYIDRIKKNKLEFGIFLMDNDSEEEINLFFNCFYNSFGFRSSLDRKWFKWYYCDNPLGKCNNYIIADLQTGKWIGGFGFAKVNYIINSSSNIGGLGINGFIIPEFQGLGLYTDLIRNCLKNEHYFDSIAFSFPHSNNIPSQKGHFKSGWKEFLDMVFLELRLDNSSNNSNFEAIAENCIIECLKSYDFNLVLSQYELSFKRSYEFLKWRYNDRPDKKYTIHYVEEGCNSGYLILGYYNSRNGEIRCQIADYHFTNLTVLPKIINIAKCAAISRGSSVLDVLINPNSLPYNTFLKEAFVERDEGYKLMIYSELDKKLPLNAYLTYGDFDVI